MSRYLMKYVGTYVVRAEYDQSTNDYPRVDGNIDPSFEDIYIKCKFGTQIIHHKKDILMCYIPSKGRGLNIIREILGLDVDVDLENFDYNSKVIFDAELLDGEVYFKFRDKDLEQILEAVGYTTKGASRSPFSPKNLPKSDYKIPQSDLDKLDSISDSKDMKYAKFINVANAEFRNNIRKDMGKNYDINYEMRLKKLRFKEFVHSIGMWDKYVEFLSKKYKEQANGN